MEVPDQILQNLMRTASSRRIRRGHHIRISHKHRNLIGATTSVSFIFVNRHYSFWRLVGGDISAIKEGESLSLVRRFKLDSKLLDRLEDSDPLIREKFSSSFDICCRRELNELVLRVFSCLSRLITAARREGFSAMHVDMFIEVVTFEFLGENEDEDILQAMRDSTGVAGPASRSSIEALSARVVDDFISSDKCMICLTEYSLGTIVTQMPCAHDFHSQCIERWLSLTNSCPLCRRSI